GSATLREGDQVVGGGEVLPVPLTQRLQLRPREVVDPVAGVVDAVECADGSASGEFRAGRDVRDTTEFDVMTHDQATVLGHHHVAFKEVSAQTHGPVVSAQRALSGIYRCAPVGDDKHA